MFYVPFSYMAVFNASSSVIIKRHRNIWLDDKFLRLEITVALSIC